MTEFAISIFFLATAAVTGLVLWDCALRGQRAYRRVQRELEFSLTGAVGPAIHVPVPRAAEGTSRPGVSQPGYRSQARRVAEAPHFSVAA